MTDGAGCAGKLVDPRVLTELQAELGGDGDIVATLLQNYVALLPGRLARLRRAVAELDKDDALDAVLSMKTSSAMVGAGCLSSLAAEIESHVRLFPDCADPAGIEAKLRVMSRCADGTVTALLRASIRPSWTGDGCGGPSSRE